MSHLNQARIKIFGARGYQTLGGPPWLNRVAGWGGGGGGVKKDIVQLTFS